jgi:hypothetical protein
MIDIDLTNEFQTALTAAQAALQERARLEALARALDEQRAAAKIEAQHAGDARDTAEAEVMLAAPGDLAAAKRLKAARDRAQDTADALVKIEGAMRALPTRMSEADAKITAAAMTLEAAAAPVRDGIREAYTKELAAAVKTVSKALALGHALAAAGLSMSWLLDKVEVPHPVWGRPPMLKGPALDTGAGKENLASLWRDDPMAVALHERLLPLHQAQNGLTNHGRRIWDERSRIEAAESARARAESFRVDHGILPPSQQLQARTPPPNPHPFVPPVYRGLPERM